MPYDVSLELLEAGRPTEKFDFRNTRVTRYNYLSDTNILNISLINFNHHQMMDKRIFIVYYFIGCPNLDMPGYKVKILPGSTTAEIICPVDGQIYQYSCIGHEWRGPEVKCSPIPPKSNADGATQLSMPHGRLPLKMLKFLS